MLSNIASLLTFENLLCLYTFSVMVLSFLFHANPNTPFSKKWHFWINALISLHSMLLVHFLMLRSRFRYYIIVDLFIGLPSLLGTWGTGRDEVRNVLNANCGNGETLLRIEVSEFSTSTLSKIYDILT